MYTLNSGNVSYVVPLDHVDLNFLRRSEQIGDTVKPLWSLRQEEYTEFQLKAWRATNDEEQDTNAKNTTCHICDTQVPILYLKEHYASKKHKNYLKIIDEALSRLRNNVNMELQDTVPTTEPSKSIYFCEACCLSVFTNNKEIHEESTIHKKSTKHDEIIEKLLIEFKKDTEHSNEAIESMDGNNNSVPEKQQSKVPTQLEQVKEYINSIINKMAPGPMKIDVLDENYIVMNVNGSCFRVPIDNFNGLVADDQGFECLLCHVVFKSKNEHIWTGQHMRWIIWHLADDQCIRQINQYYSHCIICNKLIRSVGGHKILDSIHANKLKSALYNTLKSPACQTPTLTMKSEKTAAKHLQNENKEENPLKINGGNIELQTDIETKYIHYLIFRSETLPGASCRLCGCVIPDFKMNIEDHLNGKSHTREYNDLLSTNHMIKVQNGFSCDFCRIYVPETAEFEHVSSIHHKTKMKKRIATNQTYCELCRVYIDTHNFKEHRNGRAHKQKAARQTTSNVIAKSNLVDASKSYAMATSNSEDTNVSKSLVTKVVYATETVKPKSTQNMKVKDAPPSSVINIIPPEKSKIYQPTKESTQPTYTIPEIKIPNAKTPFEIKNIHPAENINQPSTSGVKKFQDTEMTNIQTFMSSQDLKATTSEKKTSDDKNIQLPQSQTKNGESELQTMVHYHLRETLNPKELLCKVCNRLVPNTPDNITTHINGNKHKTNYIDLLKSNNVIQVEENFHCNKCNVPITNKNEIDHILGNRHIKFSDDATVNDVKCDYSNSEEKKKLSSSSINIKIPEKSRIGLPSNEITQLTPPIPKTKLPNAKTPFEIKNIHPAENINQPSTSGIKKVQDTEMTNIQTFMSSQDLKATTSEKKTPDDKNIQPPQSQTKSGEPEVKMKVHYHLRETLNPKILMCKVCNRPVQNTTDNITTHINGNKHKNNYIDLLKSNNVIQVESKFHCNRCDVPITNKNEIDHILGNRHKQFSDDDTVSDVVVEPFNAKKYCEYKAKLYQFEGSCDSQFVCIICNTKVLNTMDDVINHANEVSHITKYNELLKLYRVVKSKDGFFCNICRVSITSQNELSHIYGDTHQFNIHEILEDLCETYCGFCHIDVSGKDYLKHKISDDHVKCAKNISKGALITYYYERTGKSLLKCKLCDCFINNEFNCAIDHIQGSSHITAYNKMLDLNKICPVGDKMYCLACKEIIKSEEELIHIWQRDHSDNLAFME